MPEMPDMGDFLAKFQELREKVDVETIQAIMEVVPPELMRDVMAIVTDARVQRGISQITEAVADAQDISFDLFTSLPAAVAELRESLSSAMDGLQTAYEGVDPTRVAALKAHAPAVALSLAKVGLARPEAAPLRERVASLLNTYAGKAYDGQPGASTVAVALTAMNLKATDRSRYGRAGPMIDMALDLVVPEPFISAVETVINGLAAANGIDPEYERAAWQMDATSKTLLTGAVNRYARAHGLDALPIDERLAAQGRMVNTLEKLFEGVSQDWVANGASQRVRANATRNARTALRALEGTATAAVKPKETEGPATPPRKAAPKRGGTPRPRGNGKEGLS